MERETEKQKLNRLDYQRTIGIRMDSPMQRWEFRFEAGKSVSTCTIQNPILDISDLEDFMVQVANCAGFPWVKAVDLYEVDEQAEATDGASKSEEKHKM